MIARLRHFNQLRRLRISLVLAWSMSGMAYHFNLLTRWAVIAVTVAATLFLMSDVANSASDHKATKISEQSAEINQLRTILAKCLSPGDNAIWIGEELAYCGLAMTGVRK